MKRKNQLMLNKCLFSKLNHKLYPSHNHNGNSITRHQHKHSNGGSLRGAIKDHLKALEGEAGGDICQSSKGEDQDQETQEVRGVTSVETQAIGVVIAHRAPSNGLAQRHGAHPEEEVPHHLLTSSQACLIQRRCRLRPGRATTRGAQVTLTLHKVV
ncbi:hypothetical protein VZT92_016789 [Zoarces viviparus]